MCYDPNQKARTQCLKVGNSASYKCPAESPEMCSISGVLAEVLAEATGCPSWVGTESSTGLCEFNGFHEAMCYDPKKSGRTQCLEVGKSASYKCPAESPQMCKMSGSSSGGCPSWVGKDSTTGLCRFDGFHEAMCYDPAKNGRTQCLEVGNSASYKCPTESPKKCSVSLALAEVHAEAEAT